MASTLRSTDSCLVLDEPFGSQRGMHVRARSYARDVVIEHGPAVEIEPDTTGSRVTWSCSFYPRYFGTGWFWSMVMRRTLRTISAQLAAAPLAVKAASGQAT